MQIVPGRIEYLRLGVGKNAYLRTPARRARYRRWLRSETDQQQNGWTFRLLENSKDMIVQRCEFMIAGFRSRTVQQRLEETVQKVSEY
jgi:hypothetical protein